jgi:hypothetical protein
MLALKASFTVKITVCEPTSETEFVNKLKVVPDIVRYVGLGFKV